MNHARAQELERTAAQNRPNWALALLFLTVTVNILDRQIVNILAQDIKTDLDISDGQLGLLTGTAFGIFYAVLGVPLGRLADRMDRVRLIGICLVVWSAFTVAAGFARNFVELGLARIGVGAGEAGCVPASVALVSDLFPAKSRTSAISVMMLGMPVGTFAGLLFGGVVGESFGWRMALVLAGIPGMLLALLLVTSVVDPRTRQDRILASKKSAEEDQSTLPAAKTLMRRPGYALLAAGMTSSMLVAAVTAAWLPAFFIREHNIGVAEMGVYAAIAIGVGGAIGTLGSGLLCDVLRSYVRDVESKFVIASLLLCIPALLVTVLSPDRFLALAAMFVLYVAAFSYLAPTSMLIQNAATEDTRSLALALGISLGNIVSLGLAIPLIGLLSDMLAPQLGTASIGYALIVVALVGAIGAVAHWRALRALRQHSDAAASEILDRK
ncbi:MAG: MFS transporter [Parasphingorhabdus sp.]|nr:MFS transporter [Parasphingorhabdus sp.]